MKQTSIEWVLQYLNNVKPNEFCSIEKIKELLEQAKEMHKQEIIDAYYQCGRDNFEHIKFINRSATEYYQETFVSKGSDETKEESLVEKMIPHQLKYNLDVMEKLASTIPKQQISDEEIEKAAKECRFEDLDISVGSFELGSKWYREQLKHKL
jgi:hypothetical protein